MNDFKFQSGYHHIRGDAGLTVTPLFVGRVVLDGMKSWGRVTFGGFQSQPGDVVQVSPSHDLIHALDVIAAHAVLVRDVVLHRAQRRRHARGLAYRQLREGLPARGMESGRAGSAGGWIRTPAYGVVAQDGTHAITHDTYL